jgi:hypothetical protein
MNGQLRPGRFDEVRIGRGDIPVGVRVQDIFYGQPRSLGLGQNRLDIPAGVDYRALKGLGATNDVAIGIGWPEGQCLDDQRRSPDLISVQPL